MDIGAAAIDYSISSNFSTNIKFVNYNSLLESFAWGFYIGLITILIKFFDNLFFSKNNK